MDPPTRRDKKSVANSDPGLRGIEIHNIEIVESFRCLVFVRVRVILTFSPRPRTLHMLLILFIIPVKNDKKYASPRRDKKFVYGQCWPVVAKKLREDWPRLENHPSMSPMLQIYPDVTFTPPRTHQFL